MSFHEVTIGPCRLILGDCLSVLPTLAPGSVDAVVTDPPYGVNFKYESHDDSPTNHNESIPVLFGMLRTVCKEPGPIAVSTGQFFIARWLSLRERPLWIMCWHKPACMGRCAVGFNNWEPIVVWGKARGRNLNDVIYAPILVSEDIDHPCPKPLRWAEGVCERVSQTGDVTLDPFMGSGTTGVACVNLDRKFIGIEKEEKYFQESCNRIQRAWDLKCSELPFEKPEPARQLELV